MVKFIEEWKKADEANTKLLVDLHQQNKLIDAGLVDVLNKSKELEHQIQDCNHKCAMILEELKDDDDEPNVQFP